MARRLITLALCAGMALLVVVSTATISTAAPVAPKLVADIRPSEVTQPAGPAHGIPPALRQMAVWESTPTDYPAADYHRLAQLGYKTVFIRAANGDGTGSRDYSLFQQTWSVRAPAARAAGLTPIPWTYWFGPSEGAPADLPGYLMDSAIYTSVLASDAPAWVIDYEDREATGLPAALAELGARSHKPVFLTPPGDPLTYGLHWDWPALNRSVTGYMPQLYTADWKGTPSWDSALAEFTTAGANAPLLPVLNETEPENVVQVVTRARAQGFVGASYWFVFGGDEDTLTAYQAAWGGRQVDLGPPRLKASNPMPGCPVHQLVSQGYGPTDYAGEPTMRGAAYYHTGVDFGCPGGTTVVNVGGAGTVHLTPSASGYGLSVVVDITTREGHWFVRYGHLADYLVQDGQHVAPNTPLGHEGSTGWSSGPHLHFEVDQDAPDLSHCVDPGPWIAA